MRMREYARAVAMIAAMAVSVLGAGAQESLEALSADGAVSLALANNRGLARSRISLEAAARAVGVSWNGLLPGLSLQAGVAGSGAAGSGEADSATAYGALTASASLSLGVVGDIDAASLAYQSEEVAYATARRALELEVRKAYYALALARGKIALLEQNVETARKGYEQAEAKRAAGMAPELDALSALVALENQRPELEAARLSYEDQLDEFRLLLGLDRGAAVSLSGSLDDIASIEGVDLAGIAASSPDVAAMEKKLAAAMAAEDAAVMAIYSPTLSLSGSLKPAYSAGVWTDSASLSAVVSLSLDGLLPWSAARSAAASAGDTVRTLESQLAEARTSADMSVASLLRQIEQSLSALKTMKLARTLAEKTYRLTEEAYRFGTKDLQSLQSARDGLAEAGLNVSEEAYTLVSAVLDLEYALGVPFGTLGR